MNKYSYYLAFLTLGCVGSLCSQTLEFFDLQKKCAAEAKKYYLENKTDLIPPRSGTTVLYEYHYNKKRELCLLRVHGSNGNYPYFTFDSVLSVLENKSIASYHEGINDKNDSKILCNYDGKKCSNAIDFKKIVDILMME